MIVFKSRHYSDVSMASIASQITSLTIVYSSVYSGAGEGKHQSSASLAFVRGIHRRPVNSPHKGPVTRKMFPFDDVIKGSSSGVVGSTGAYGRLSGHPAGPVLGWVARVEYPVPKHYTCQAVRSGFRESFSWLSIVLRMRRKIEVPPT